MKDPFEFVRLVNEGHQLGEDPQRRATWAGKFTAVIGQALRDALPPGFRFFLAIEANGDGVLMTGSTFEPERLPAVLQQSVLAMLEGQGEGGSAP